MFVTSSSKNNSKFERITAALEDARENVTWVPSSDELCRIFQGIFALFLLAFGVGGTLQELFKH